MDRLRIYIDTSVLGGCFDEEFSVWSNGLIRDFLAGRFIPVLSDVTAAEVREAPEAVQEVHREMLRLAGGVLPVTAAVVGLVEAYRSRQILPAKFTADMTHIALATLADRRPGQLELQAHRASRKDPAVQRCQRRIGVPNPEYPLPAGGHHP